MRKVPLKNLTSDMVLAKAVCKGTSVLIREGTSGLHNYISRLERLGVNGLYVDDKASDGIYIDDLVTDQTRMKCKQTLESSFEKLRSDFAIDQGRFMDSIENLMHDIMSRQNMLVSLNDIGSIQDNTLDHSVNTTIYAVCLGLQLGYDTMRLKDLAQGTLLHDVGKTMLDSRILFKPGRLTEEEFAHIKQHSQLGYDILNKTSTLSEPAKRISLYHHERLDGSGYPFGMWGDELSELVRIVSIVDVYEALSVDRCYRMALPPQRAMEVLAQEAASKLDFGLATIFMQNIAVYPNGSMVYLSDGRVGVVKEQNHSMPLRPVIRVLTMEDGQYEPQEEIDLMKVLNITLVDSEMEALQ